MGKRERLTLPKARVAKMYAAAKVQNDMAAAFDLVDLLYKDAVEDALVDMIMEAGRAPIFCETLPGVRRPSLD